MTATRIESDSLGDIEVPAEAYCGAQSERARRNFPVSGPVLPRRFLAAIGALKSEAAVVNAERGIVRNELAAAILKAADEVAEGKLDDQFPVDVFQTGSGTSSNMNANEVIANRAIELLGGERGSKELVHPNDHVNAGQSSNDVIPTAIHVAAYGAIAEELVPALARLAAALEAKARSSTTSSRSAAPTSRMPCRCASARSSAATRSRCATASPGSRRWARLAELALGGTAVGTGLERPAGFRRRGHRPARGEHRPAVRARAEPASRRWPPRTRRSRLRARSRRRGR